MAEEKNIATKAELREKAEVLIKSFNDAVQSGKYEVSARTHEEIEGTINAYTALVREECFAALAATEDPMLEAVKQLTYPTIRFKDTKVGEEKVPVRVLEDTEKAIDLLKLHKFVDGGIGAAANWALVAEKFNFLMTAQKALDLGIDPKEVNDSYAMEALSREIDMGKTPTSKTKILGTLQSVISAMVGEEFKVTSHDVNFLTAIYSRKKNGKALTVSCANHKFMRQYLAEICHRVVLGKAYAVDYKKTNK